MKTTEMGKVYLVGAGPGDPGLITLKGRDCIRGADVLIYDYLASPPLLDYAREDAEIIYVGKRGGDHTMAQDRINALIVEKAMAGLTVTRLKGGDPFIFGRGGEEAEVLADNGIPFDIVPGVTSAVAAPAYAGIPLTHRDFTSTLAFVTGHEDPLKEESSIDWASLAKGIGTIVFLMGIKNLPRIVERLMENGLSAQTPAAVVRWGTMAGQITVSGVLGDIQHRTVEAGIKAPAVVVVGKVAGLRDKLKWFENRPLFGKTIVVTRARAQAGDLVKQLSDLGAECLECPTIRVTPPDDIGPLDAAVNSVADYDWIIFTSVNGVIRFFDRLNELGLDTRALGRIRTAAIGPSTAEKMAAYGLKTDVLPDSYRAESVVAAFENRDMHGKKVLIPRALDARPILPEKLRESGALVTEVPVYKTVFADQNADRLIKRLGEKSVHLVTFTSSSTAANFRKLLPEDETLMKSLMEGVKTASIGPITSETAENMGFNVDITARTYTIPGLCEAILNHYRP